MLDRVTLFYSLPPSATEIALDFTAVKGGDIEYTDSRKDGQVYFETELRSTFVSYGADYDTLEALRLANACDEVLIHIYYDAVEVDQRSINLKKAKWFPDKCTVEFGGDKEDIYTCIKENWSTDTNIFSAGPVKEVQSFFGTPTPITCGPLNQASAIKIMGFFEQNVNGCLGGDDSAYTIIRAYIDLVPGAPDTYDHYATYSSEKVLARPCIGGIGGVPDPPPGAGWIELANNCATLGTCDYGRPVQVTYEGEQQATTGYVWDNLYSITGAKTTAFGNGVLFSDIIQDLIDPCGLTVVSDFFDINADATAPSNTAYTASEALYNLMVFQKSDIKRPDDSTPATVGNMKLKDMLSWLATMFNVFWKIEGTDLRLEHISYFEGSNGEDLTINQLGAVEYRNNFTYDGDKLAPRESFRWMDETVDPDFNGLDIIYTGACVDYELEPLLNTVDAVFTDLGRIDSNVDAVSDDGFFFMATDEDGGTYYINREVAELSGSVKANAHLSWANLQENYLTWNRLQATGNLNNVGQTFNSYIRSKRQQSIPVSLGVAEYFALDKSDKLNTLLGWGSISRGNYSFANCTYLVELLQED